MNLKRSHRFDARPHAIIFVLGSGVLLFLLAFVLQAVAWEAKVIVRALGTEPPFLTEQFIDLFGLRPHEYLWSMTFWFWWPMVASLVYCLFRYRHHREFAMAFLYWMATCWLLVATGIVFVLFLLSLLSYILLADVEQPPDFMEWVPTISAALPVAVGLFACFCWWRFARQDKRKQ